jgi:hypothetical protein
MVLTAFTNAQLSNLKIRWKNGITLKWYSSERWNEWIEDDGFYIINFDDSNGDGTHWTALYYHPLKSYSCDLLGFVPPFEVWRNFEKIKPLEVEKK